MTIPWQRLLPSFLRRHLVGRIYLQRVIENTGWVMAERILKHAVGFLVGVWIARYVGPHLYGLFNYAGSFVAVFAFMSTLGLDGLVVRDLVRDPGSRERTLGTLLAMRLAGSLLMLLVISAAIFVVDFGDEDAAQLILIISLAQIVLTIDTLDYWFQANVASRYTAMAKISALLLIGVVRVILIVRQAPLVAFAWAILAESLVFAAAMLLAYARAGEHISKLRPHLDLAKSYLARGWPLLTLALVVATSQRIDQVMLGELSTYTEVGTYAVAVRIVEVAYVFPAVLATSVFPAMIKARASNPHQYEKQIQTLFGLGFWSAIGVSLPLSFLSPFIVDLMFGSAFAAAAPVLGVLAWAPALMFFSIIRQRWLFAEDALHAAMTLEICTCILSVLANALLIPRHGALGAAMASILAMGGATLVVAPFSAKVRRSLELLLRGTAAPLRVLADKLQTR